MRSESLLTLLAVISADELEIRIELEEDDVPAEGDDDDDENALVLGGEPGRSTVPMLSIEYYTFFPSF